MNKKEISKLISQQMEIAIKKLKREIKIIGVKKKTKIAKRPASKKKTKHAHMELIDKIKNIRIDDQKYPLVKNNDDILIKCLFILEIVKNEAGIKELTAPQIEASALFFNKLKISRQAARGILDRHTEYVSIRREGPKKIFYSIKKEGVKYYKNYAQEKKKSGPKTK